MTKLSYLYRYRLNKKDLEYAIKSISERSGDPMDQTEEFKQDVKVLILDLLKKFHIYYTDDDRDMINENKKYYHKDPSRHSYEVILTLKTDKRIKFRSFITLAPFPYNNRYSLDLSYILDSLAFSAADSSFGIGETDKEAKDKDDESNKLWKFLDVLDNKEGFWLDVFGMSF